MEGMTTQRAAQALNESSGILHHWGSAVDGAAILSAQCGGQRKPAVLITAGVHAHEVGGVWAALELMEQLQTQQEVHILPLRDPFGFSGVNHCLSFAAGSQIALADHASILGYLGEHASIIWQQDDINCFKLGDLGFVWHPELKGLESFQRVNAQMTAALKEEPFVFSALFGKRVMMVNPAPYSEPGARMARCWHAWISTDGRWLNLNRGFGEAEQPAEVSALQNALEIIQPGLVIDLQEDDTAGFWFARPFSHRDDPLTSHLFSAAFETIQEKQIPLYHASQMKTEIHRDLEIQGFLQPDEMFPGVYWLNQTLLGQGENFLSYAGHRAAAIGIEAPMKLPLKRRVKETVDILSAFITGWQQRVSL